MKKVKRHLFAVALIFIFFMLALASTPPRHTTYSKPIHYPCVQHAPITYSPILVKLNISSNYTMKDLPGVRSSDPELIMSALHTYNYNYKLADGVTPNLVLNVTYTNDGYDHFGVSLNVDYQGEGNFTINLPANYITISKLIDDMAKELNTWVTNGWHSGDCSVQPPSKKKK